MDLKPVVSGHIAAVGYDVEKQRLEVIFQNGARYEYFGVPPEIHEEMMDAPSIGQYHAFQIRGKFTHGKVEDTPADQDSSDAPGV